MESEKDLQTNTNTQNIIESNGNIEQGPEENTFVCLIIKDLSNNYIRYDVSFKFYFFKGAKLQSCLWNQKVLIGNSQCLLYH
jgi:hypothetical protein